MRGKRWRRQMAQPVHTSVHWQEWEERLSVVGGIILLAVIYSKLLGLW